MKYSPKIDKQNIFKTETEIVRNALKNEGFFIVVVSSHSVNEARECIDAFSMGKEGVLFIHNYAHEKSPSHHLYAVERGLRIIELPDGSRGVLPLTIKKTPAKSRGNWLWRIFTSFTAVIVEPIVVAD